METCLLFVYQEIYGFYFLSFEIFVIVETVVSHRDYLAENLINAIEISLSLFSPRFVEEI